MAKKHRTGMELLRDADNLLNGTPLDIGEPGAALRYFQRMARLGEEIRAYLALVDGGSAKSKELMS